MDKFIEETLNKIKYVNLNIKLNDEQAKKAEKILQDTYKKIKDNVDNELNQIEEVKNIKTELKDLKEIINFDIEEYFRITEDRYTYDGDEIDEFDLGFNKKEHDEKLELVTNWPQKIEELHKRRSEIENKFIPKFIKNTIISKIDSEINITKRDYEYYSKIFEKADEVNRYDKQEVREKIDNLETKLNNIELQLIDKQLEGILLEIPALILYDNQYTKNELLSKRLHEIYEAYNSENLKNNELGMEL